MPFQAKSFVLYNETFNPLVVEFKFNIQIYWIEYLDRICIIDLTWYNNFLSLWLTFIHIWSNLMR